MRVEVGTLEGALVNQALTKESNISDVILAEQGVTVDLAIRVLVIRFRSRESRLVEGERKTNPT
jgi:hypothetical protein